MSEGKDDRSIANTMGIAQSTVRNHRFKLREKEKQAKLFLALMQSLEDKTRRSISQTDTGVIEEIHQTAKAAGLDTIREELKAQLQAFLDMKNSAK